ncbi:hypothetical protein FOA52_003850 [Chlamydomonas sp. UWO 241]|nr:hypothetical protein FOA52_003850 [Chlamydomonas sp. UWO 241]
MASSLDDVLQKAADWPGTERLAAVQDSLDKNKMIINEINRNHTLCTRESLQRNVILIQEANSNITKVVQSYQELALQADVPGSNQEQAL